MLDMNEKRLLELSHNTDYSHHHSVNYFSGQVSHKKSTLVIFLLVFLRQLFSDNCLNPLDAYIVECS